MDMKHGRNRYQWIAWIKTELDKQMLTTRTKQKKFNIIHQIQSSLKQQSQVQTS